MGVTYKLTEEIVHFILEQKRAAPQLSCRELVSKIEVQFQKEVSKSSVHEVLKEAQIASPLGRKHKSKFQIPAEKKARLFAPPVVIIPEKLPPPASAPVINLPAIKESLPVQEKAVETEPAPLKPLTASEIQAGMGEVIIEAAFRDIFPMPWRDVKTLHDLKSIDFNVLEEELAYRSLPMMFFKLTLEDGSSIVLDSRLQTIKADPALLPDLSCPLEKAIVEATNCFVNNLQPIVIKELTEEHLGAAFFDFMMACEAKSGKNIVTIAVYKNQGEEMAVFQAGEGTKRQFIVGVDTQVNDIKRLMNISSEIAATVNVYCYPEPINYLTKTLELNHIVLRALVILDAASQPVKVLISNMPFDISAAAIIRHYMMQHPIERQLVFAPRPVDVISDYMGYLMNVAQTFFPQPLNQEKWKEIIDIKGFTEINDEIKCVNLCVPEGYSINDDLQKAIDTINAMGIKDEQGRALWINARRH